MTTVATGLTSAQRDLIGFLIDEALRDPVELERRWLNAAAFVRDRAKSGQLVLLREWTQTTVITRNGDVLVVDTEEGAPDRPATQAERYLALFHSIRQFPELLSLLPPRPAGASDCPDCLGTGLHREVLSNPVLRSVSCRCGGAGWISLPGSGADAE